MSKNKHDFNSLLDRLSEKIKISNDVNLLINVTQEINGFNETIKEYCEKKSLENNDGLNNNDELFKLINDKLSKLADEIKELSRETDVIPELNALEISTKIAIAGSTLLVISIAMASFIFLSKKNKENRKREHEKPATNLLLIIPANKLDVHLVNKPLINGIDANQLIVNSVEAYCYLDGDIKGNEIMQNVKFSANSSDIDYETESRIFVHLKLHADHDIANQRNKLGLREKIDFKSPITIENIGKRQKASSTSEFFEI